MPDTVTAFNFPVPAPGVGSEWAPREDVQDTEAFRRELARAERPDTGASDRRRPLERRSANEAASEPSAGAACAENCDTAESSDARPQETQGARDVKPAREASAPKSAPESEAAAEAQPTALPSPQTAVKTDDTDDIVPDVPTALPGAGLVVPVEMPAVPVAVLDLLSLQLPSAGAQGADATDVLTATPAPALDAPAPTTPAVAASSTPIESVSGVLAPDTLKPSPLAAAPDVPALVKSDGKPAMAAPSAMPQHADVPASGLSATPLAPAPPPPAAVASSAAPSIAPEIAAAIPVQLAAIATDGEKPKAAPAATIEAAVAKAAGTASGLATAFPDALKPAQPQHSNAQITGAHAATTATANTAAPQSAFSSELAAQQDSSAQPAPVAPGGAAGAHPAAAHTIQAQTNPARIPPETLAYEIKRQHANGVNRFEIRLDPPELGRIDVRLEVADDGSTRAHLSADRADTLDLLQRDARALERALNSLGLKTERDGIAFSLRQDGAETGLDREARDGNRNGAPGFISFADDGDDLAASAASQAGESSRYSNMRLNIVI